MSQPVFWLWRIKRLYVRFMLAFMGHALAKASQSDTMINNALKSLPNGFSFSLRVMPAGPALCMKKVNGRLKPLSSTTTGQDIQFKHLEHAFAALSFQEGTTMAFARERMVVDGDLQASMRLIRCIERLEVMILPKLVALRVIRHYPSLSLGKKLTGACRIYLGVLSGFVMGYK